MRTELDEDAVRHRADPVFLRPDGELPTAVLWDMDGTLIDSEPYWIEQEFRLVESFGGTWSDEMSHQMVGKDLLWSADFIRENTPVDLQPVELVHRLQEGVIQRMREAVPWRPGARDLLADLRHRGVPCALVTMSWSQLTHEVVACLPEGSFDVVVTGDDVAHGKPHPEPYLRAARELGVPVEQCVAIEDSPTGVASASAAGAQTIWVPNLVEVDVSDGVRRVETLVGMRVCR